MRFFVLILTFLIVHANVKGGSFAERDSIKHYVLGEVRTFADREYKAVQSSEIVELKYYEIQEIDAVSISGIIERTPSAITQTNSRGESVLFLRGMGERQIGIFLDGALLNLPWDNRVDLNIIPSDIIGKIRIIRGSESSLFGANVLGGAVNINSLERSSDGFGGILRYQASDANGHYLSATQDGKIGNYNYLANFSYNTSDGYTLSSEAPELNNQDQKSNIRSNTDNNRLSFLLRNEYKISELRIGLTVNHIDAEKSVAPETHRTVSKSRYWKYPLWKRTMVTLNADNSFGENKEFQLKTTLWYDAFDQQIDSYSDFSYSKIDKSLLDNDNTFGSRIVAAYLPKKDIVISFAANFYTHNHNEREYEEDSYSDLEFSQSVFNSGFEYRHNFDKSTLLFSANIDGTVHHKTGSYVESEGTTFSDYGISAGYGYEINDKTNIFINTNRKTRFPTLREAYSASIDKFVVNPNLRSESGFLNEIGINTEILNFDFGVTAFADFYQDMLAKISAPNSGGKEMRVNLGSASIYGTELKLNTELFDVLDLRSFITYMYSYGYLDDDEVELEYIPVVMGYISAKYRTVFGLALITEAEFKGNQYGLDSQVDIMKKLSPSFILNFRVSYLISSSEFMTNEIFLRVNNILDSYYLDKIGLPASGRMFTLGYAANL